MKTLLYCWVSQTFSVLVPKKRGSGYLKVPYGHHYNEALSNISYAAGADVTGLDGALEFECGTRVFYGDETVRKAFALKVIPGLEAHYGYPSREVQPSEFWGSHPLMGGR